MLECTQVFITFNFSGGVAWAKMAAWERSSADAGTAAWKKILPLSVTAKGKKGKCSYRKYSTHDCDSPQVRSPVDHHVAYQESRGADLGRGLPDVGVEPRHGTTATSRGWAAVRGRLEIDQIADWRRLVLPDPPGWKFQRQGWWHLNNIKISISQATSDPCCTTKTTSSKARFS